MHVRTIDGSNVDRYYHYDRLGNVMNVTDESGLALVNYVQEGFGNVLLTQEDFARLEMHSPIAAYDLPEGSGSSTADRTSNNYDGTISGASWATGEFTYGLSFDGSDDKISFSTHPSTSGSFSVAAWVKIDSTSGFHPVATNFTPGMDIELKGWRFGVSGGKVCLQLWDQWEEPYEALGSTTLSTSKWYLIAATYDSSGGAMKVYVNGADDTSGSPTGDYTTGDNFGIGWDGVAHAMTQYYDGLIDSVAVWNAKLSATEVEQLWDSGDTSGYHLTTKEYDPDTGLYYFWQRWYDPFLGRFASRSPYPPDIEHSYIYCSSNPINLVDPEGEAGCLLVILISCVVVGILVDQCSKKAVEPTRQRICRSIAAANAYQLNAIIAGERDPVRKELLERCQRHLQNAARNSILIDNCYALEFARRVCLLAGVIIRGL
jgi:RHS repeat-associated protein